MPLRTSAYAVNVMSTPTRRLFVTVAAVWLTFSACLPSFGIGMWYTAIDTPEPDATQAAIGSALMKVGGRMLWPMLNQDGQFFPLIAPSELPGGTGLLLSAVITVFIPLVLNSLLWAAVVTGAIVVIRRLRR